MTGVFIKTYPEPEFNIKEILRYSGCREQKEDIEALINDCIKECRAVFSYKVCYTEFDLTDDFLDIESKTLAKNLQNCHKAVLFAGTVGIEIDRIISKYSKISPSKAVIFQAIGAERIEALCDLFCDEIKAEYEKKNEYTMPRFSPGYADFPLMAQREIFKILDCPRKIGMVLNESLVMSPTKSVTAIIGISKEKKECKNGCEACDNKNCALRERTE